MNSIDDEIKEEEDPLSHLKPSVHWMPIECGGTDLKTFLLRIGFLLQAALIDRQTGSTEATSNLFTSHMDCFVCVCVRVLIIGFNFFFGVYQSQAA